MNQLSSIQKSKLNKVKSLIRQLKEILQENGLTNSNIEAYFVDLIKNSFYANQINHLQSIKTIDQIVIKTLLEQKTDIVLVLRKLQALFHTQKCSLLSAVEQEESKVKNLQNISQKIKNKKKEKRDNRKKSGTGVIQKKNTKSTDNQNLNAKQELSLLTSLFKPLKPLQQSSLNGICVPLQNQNKAQEGSNRFYLANEELKDKKEELKQNLLQINFLKRFLEKQMAMDMLLEREMIEM